MNNSKRRSLVARVLIALVVLAGLHSTGVSAAMVSTETVIATEQHNYQREELLTALESEQLQQQLLDLGVDPDQVRDRVASLTPAEIAELNQQIQDQPAGSSVLGALVLIFVVFIITDALCATDVFSFVNCIN